MSKSREQMSSVFRCRQKSKKVLKTPKASTCCKQRQGTWFDHHVFYAFDRGESPDWVPFSSAWETGCFQKEDALCQKEPSSALPLRQHISKPVFGGLVWTSPFFNGMMRPITTPGSDQGGHMRILLSPMFSCLLLIMLATAAAADTTGTVPPASGGEKAAVFPAENQYCLACHQGIEPTRPPKSGMMQAIFAKGRELGDPNGCVVCHAGTPAEVKDKDKAHSGAPAGSRLAAFTATPGALQLNDATCVQCHADHVYAVTRSSTAIMILTIRTA